MDSQEEKSKENEDLGARREGEPSASTAAATAGNARAASSSNSEARTTRIRCARMLHFLRPTKKTRATNADPPSEGADEERGNNASGNTTREETEGEMTAGAVSCEPSGFFFRPFSSPWHVGSIRNIHTKELPQLPPSPREPPAESLPVANPVAPLEIHASPLAEDQGNSDNQAVGRCDKRLVLNLICFASVLAAIVAVVAPVTPVVTDNNQDTPIQMNVSEKVTMLLPNHTFDELDDPESAQAKAFNWLLGDPNVAEYADWRIIQRFALATLFYSTGGDLNDSKNKWYRHDGWLDYSVHECDWHSNKESAGSVHDNFLILGSHHYVFFDYSNETFCTGIDQEEMQHIWLPSNGLEGTLPPELYLLTSMRTMVLRVNALQGTLSSLIGMLSHLRFLDVASPRDGVRMEGRLPTEIGLLPDLEGIFAAHNKFSGVIPSELGMLPKMEFVRLHNNTFTGSIPSEIGLLYNLAWINLGSNRLVGTIPSELGQLSQKTLRSDRAWYRRVYLYENKLTGHIPTELGEIDFLQNLVIGDNPLSGSIPSELGNLKHPAPPCIIGIYNTNVSGKIPSELGRLWPMEALWLSNNSLTGTIPSELSGFDDLWGLALNENNLSGTIPSEIFSNKLLGLVLNGNELSGPIPSEIGLLAPNSMFPVPGVQFEIKDTLLLVLSDNALTGPVPTEIGNLVGLEKLALHRNRLSGTLPSTLGRLFQYSFLSIFDLTRIDILGRYFDLLSPFVPSGSSLSLEHNKISGILPSELGFMEGLNLLRLGNNKISGILPSELGLMTDLKLLRLGNNRIGGVLPSEVGLMTRLKWIDIAANMLSGTVPEELTSLVDDRLVDLFNISNNALTGVIPSDFCVLESDRILSFDCTDSLCGCNCTCPVP